MLSLQLSSWLLVLGSIFLLSASLGEANAVPTARCLGTPVKAMSIRDSLLVKDRLTGRPVLYTGTYTSAGSARLIRYDYTEGKVVYFSLPGVKGAYGLCEDEDGRIFIGTVESGRIFSLDPATGTVTNHGGVPGELYVWILRRGPDGRIYGGTYPNAKLVAYDPSLDEVLDLGRMHPTEWYVRDLAVAENGRVFCGIGSHADLVAYDPHTEEKRSILPDRYKNNSFVYPQSKENLVYASVHTDYVILVYDADTYELITEISHPEGLPIGTRQIPDGPIIIIGLPGGGMRFNKTTRQLEPYDTPAYYHYDQETGIAYTVDGQVFSAYNVTEDRLVGQVDVSKDGEGMDIFSLGSGPDGCIYGGSFNLLHLFKYDPTTGDLEDLGVPFPGALGEIYSFHTDDGKLYMASYIGSVLSVYDPTKPWSPGTDRESNPRKIGPVGDEQYRPPGLVSAADGKIYIGSLPAYGKMGGALSIYDPPTDGFDVHRNIIANQSVISLATSVDGWMVYGGSSLFGGGGTTPVADEAHFFAWDVQREELVLDIVPQEGAYQVQCLVTGPDGRIYGCADISFFVFDPEIGLIVHKEASQVGGIYRMVVAKDGLIYGTSTSGLFRMKPISEANEKPLFESLQVSGHPMALDREDRIYFGKGTDLFILENVPRVEAPSTDLVIYGDELQEGWRVEPTRADLDLSSTEMVQEGRCQRISFDRVCLLRFLPPDPWDITLWEYDYLALSINPGNSTLNQFEITKTGPGSTESVSVDDFNVTLSPGKWTMLRIPVVDLGWEFGSRLESLKLTVTGTGSFYLDSVSLRISETLGSCLLLSLLMGIGLVLLDKS